MGGGRAGRGDGSWGGGAGWGVGVVGGRESEEYISNRFGEICFETFPKSMFRNKSEQCNPKPSGIICSETSRKNIFRDLSNEGVSKYVG